MQSKEIELKKILENAGLRYSQIFQILKEVKNKGLLKECKENKKSNINYTFLLRQIEKKEEGYKNLGLKRLKEKIEKIKTNVAEGKIVRALEEIVKIEKALERKLEKKEEKEKNELDGKELKDFVRFYQEIWINTTGHLPPEREKLDEDKFYAYIINIAKKFNDLEKAKEVYKFWLKLDIEDLPKDMKRNYKYKSILIGRSGRTLREFYKNYELILALKEDIEKMKQKHKGGFLNPFLPV